MCVPLILWQAPLYHYTLIGILDRTCFACMQAASEQRVSSVSAPPNGIRSQGSGAAAAAARKDVTAAGTEEGVPPPRKAAVPIFRNQEASRREAAQASIEVPAVVTHSPRPATPPVPRSRSTTGSRTAPPTAAPPPPITHAEQHGRERAASISGRTAAAAAAGAMAGVATAAVLRPPSPGAPPNAKSVERYPGEAAVATANRVTAASPAAYRGGSQPNGREAPRDVQYAYADNSSDDESSQKSDDLLAEAVGDLDIRENLEPTPSLSPGWVSHRRGQSQDSEEELRDRPLPHTQMSPAGHVRSFSGGQPPLHRSSSQSSERTAMNRTASGASLSSLPGSGGSRMLRTSSLSSEAAIASLSRMARQTTEKINSRQTVPLPADLESEYRNRDTEQDAYSDRGSVAQVRGLLSIIPVGLQSQDK